MHALDVNSNQPIIKFKMKHICQADGKYKLKSHPGGCY